jgi:hypothetical protein
MKFGNTVVEKCKVASPMHIMSGVAQVAQPMIFLVFKQYIR